MKKWILFIGTGGTIASEMSDEGLLPGVGASALLGYVPDVAELCEAESVQLFDLDSTNIGPAEWLEMARAVRESYARFDGFVISHGTDTMAYTAGGAELSHPAQPEAHRSDRGAEADRLRHDGLAPEPAGRLRLRLRRGDARGVHRVQLPGDTRHAGAQDSLEELRRLFEHQLSEHRGCARRAHPALHRAGARAGAGVLRRSWRRGWGF